MKLAFNTWSHHGLILLTGLLVFLGCSSQIPAPQLAETETPTIKVDGLSLPSISFEEVYADIPGDRIIGYVHEGLQNTRTFEITWDENFNNETRALNFRAGVILEDSGYLVEKESDGEVRMKGTMRRLRLDTFSYKGSFDEAECEMKWELFRNNEKVPYFTKLSIGTSRIETQKSGAIGLAFDSSLRRLLANRDFVQALKNQEKD